MSYMSWERICGIATSVVASCAMFTMLRLTLAFSWQLWLLQEVEDVKKCTSSPWNTSMYFVSTF